MANNKFASAFSALRQTPNETDAPAARDDVPQAKSKSATTTTRRREPRRRAALEQKPAEQGRSIGKRSDPAYRQVGMRIRAQTHDEAVIRLRRTKEHADFSELVQSLVDQWLKS